MQDGRAGSSTPSPDAAAAVSVAAAPPALELRALELRRGDRFALTIDHLRLSAGSSALVVGPSGSGKSSLFDAILGVISPGDPLVVRGDIRIRGMPRPAPRTKRLRALLASEIVALPQDAIAALDPLRTLAEQIAPRANVDLEHLAAALGELGLREPRRLLDRHPHQISGGQAQGMLLAIALCRRPALCLFDEPTAGLDAARVDELVAALDRLRTAHRGCAFLFASHDPRLRSRIDTERYAIADGRLVRGEDRLPGFPAAVRCRHPGDVLLSAKGISIAYHGTDVVSGFDLDLNAGEIVALLGPSGVGKTSLARVLAGHTRARRGTVELHVPPRAVQMLFQDASGSLTPGLRMRLQCAEVAAPDFDLDTEARRLGLDPALLDRTVSEVSGGECRRIALLRSLCVRPRVLLLDEPTANLDRVTARGVVDLLLQVRERFAVAMLWITHDDELADAVADRVVRLAPPGDCEESPIP